MIRAIINWMVGIIESFFGMTIFVAFVGFIPLVLDAINLTGWESFEAAAKSIACLACAAYFPYEIGTLVKGR